MKVIFIMALLTLIIRHLKKRRSIRALENKQFIQAIKSGKKIILIVFSLSIDSFLNIKEKKKASERLNIVKKVIFNELEKILPENRIIENTESAEISLILIDSDFNFAVELAQEIVRFEYLSVSISAGIKEFDPDHAKESFAEVNTAAERAKKVGRGFIFFS